MKLDLEAIKARCEAASPPPWQAGRDHAGPREHIRNGAGVLFGISEWWTIRTGRHKVRQYQADVAFVTHARQDVPALVVEVERLRGIIEAASDMTLYAWESEDGAAAQTRSNPW